MTPTRKPTPLLAFLALGFAACWWSACVLGDKKGPTEDSEGQVSPGADMAEEVDTGVSGAASILAGCTHVQWCDEPGSRGSICIQDGCTHQQAVNECCEDIAFVCGAPTNPAFIVHPDVTHQIICP
jgi:hypothetical protein